MFKQNVPGWERAARAVAGLAVVIGGVWWALAGEVLSGSLMAAGGAGLVGTALVGWCPLCAMVGRTLPKVDKKVVIARM